MNETNLPISRILHTLLFLTFWFLIFLNLPNLCSGEDHHHHHHHHHHNHHHQHEQEDASFKYSRQANEPYHERTSRELPKDAGESWSIWSQALCSTLLISAAPFFILFFVPLDKSKEKEPLLKILLSFASGGLLGDSFLHLIPHALTPHAHHSHENEKSNSDHHSDEHHEHGHDMTVGFFVLLGIVIFLIVEKCVRLVNTGHSHSHSVNQKNSKKETNGKGDHASKKSDNSAKDSRKKSEQKKKGAISVAGYLNLAADFTHNLTDGLAIGASYLAGRNIGIITTITILLHEVPHEIGDFAILIQSGCSRRKAMGLQLVTALGAMMGTLISLMTEGIGDVAFSWILPFTAGGFIYISTVSIIPELLEDSKFVQSIKEIVAMLVGVLLMVIIADFE